MLTTGICALDPKADRAARFPKVTAAHCMSRSPTYYLYGQIHGSDLHNSMSPAVRGLLRGVIQLNSLVSKSSSSTHTNCRRSDAVRNAACISSDEDCLELIDCGPWILVCPTTALETVLIARCDRIIHFAATDCPAGSWVG